MNTLGSCRCEGEPAFIHDEDTGYSLNITGRDCRDVKECRELNIYSNGDCTVSDRTSPPPTTQPSATRPPV